MKVVSTMLIVLLLFSCSTEIDQEVELVGEWVYARELFHSQFDIINNDPQGILTMEDDGTGIWDSQGFFDNYRIRWSILTDTLIDIIPLPANEPQQAVRRFRLYRDDEDTYRFVNRRELGGGDYIFESILVIRK